jgi:hypothetical protein
MRTYGINALAALSIVAVAACGSKAGQAAEAAQAVQTAQATRVPAAPATWMLDAGRQFAVATNDTITSRTAKAGDSFSATVLSDVPDARGRIAIPAGAPVNGTVTEVSKGTLTLAVSSVTVRGKRYPIEASIASLVPESYSQGINGGDAIKVGAGAAAGAIVGQIIAKNTKGTVIGAVVGAAAGAGVAALTKGSDVRLPAGTHILITLDQRLTITGN